MIFAASVYFQQHQNLSAAMAGLALLPAMAVTMVASALSGRLSDRFPHRRLMLVGLLTACVGLALWAVVGEAASYAVLAVAMIACGFGTSFTLTGATSTVMDAAPAGYAGTASAALNTARQTGSAAGVAISGSLIAPGRPDRRASRRSWPSAPPGTSSARSSPRSASRGSGSAPKIAARGAPGPR